MPPRVSLVYRGEAWPDTAIATGWRRYQRSVTGKRMRGAHARAGVGVGAYSGDADKDVRKAAAKGEGPAMAAGTHRRLAQHPAPARRRPAALVPPQGVTPHRMTLRAQPHAGPAPACVPLELLCLLSLQLRETAGERGKRAPTSQNSTHILSPRSTLAPRSQASFHISTCTGTSGPQVWTCGHRPQSFSRSHRWQCRSAAARHCSRRRRRVDIACVAPGARHQPTPAAATDI